jgi:hypothetical protein
MMAPTGRYVMSGIADKLDEAYEGMSVEELAKAPVAALQGVSERVFERANKSA